MNRNEQQSINNSITNQISILTFTATVKIKMPTAKEVGFLRKPAQNKKKKPIGEKSTFDILR